MVAADLEKSNDFRMSIHGVNAQISGHEAVRELQADFEYFSCNAKDFSPAIRLQIIPTAPNSQLLPLQSASSVRSECIIYDSQELGGGKLRWIDYHGKALLRRRMQGGKTQAELICADPALTHELAYLFLHSEIGRRLDEKGLHRIHGMAVAKDKIAALVLLPSGGGKSTLSISLLADHQLRLLSDDSPLVDQRGRLAPFPLRLAFTPQTELPPEWEKNTTRMLRRKYGEKKLLRVSALPTAAPAAAERFSDLRIIVGRRWGALVQPEIYPLSKSSAAPLLMRDLVIGVGLPQIAELILGSPLANLSYLPPLALKRSLAMLQLLRRAKVFELRMSSKPERNAAAIAGLLSS